MPHDPIILCLERVTSVAAIRCMFLACCLVFLGTLSVTAQGGFNSGSTGADGALSPVSNQTLQVPEGGIFNFTTVNIPSGVTLTFLPNSRNTPVTILATGDVTITGTISVNGENGLSNGVGGKGGPGGFRGGDGSLMIGTLYGSRGDGPGGGSGGSNNTSATGVAGGGGGFGTAGSNTQYPNSPHGIGGPAYGTLSLLPLIGGSGGGGGGSGNSYRGTAAGGGGGAILIASSGTITVSGTITSRGGNSFAPTSWGSTGGGGSGGAIRLIANTISGTGVLDIRGGTGGYPPAGGVGGSGGRGYVRAETYDYSGFNPNTHSLPINITLPNPVFVPNSAQLQIASIGGVLVPPTPSGSLFASPDVVLPGSIANPVSVGIQAVNVPLESVVQISVSPRTGSRTSFLSTPLTGSVTASTATASINLPSGMSVVTASLTVDLQAANTPPMYIDGQKVTHLEVTASLGRPSETTYVTVSGKRYTSSDLSR